MFYLKLYYTGVLHRIFSIPTSVLCLRATTDLNVQRHFELGGILLVDVAIADIPVLLVPNIVDGHDVNPVGFEAGRGVGRCGDIKVRVVHKHADVLKTEK